MLQNVRDQGSSERGGKRPDKQCVIVGEIFTSQSTIITTNTIATLGHAGLKWQRTSNAFAICTGTAVFDKVDEST